LSIEPCEPQIKNYEGPCPPDGRCDGAPEQAANWLTRETARRKTLKAARHSSSHVAAQETGVARLTRERDEALERETATAEVLKVISSSPGDVKSVFEAILENATRICEAHFANLLLCEGDGFRLGAMHNAPPAFVDARPLFADRFHRGP
jgi:hypothetical protein